MDKCICFLYRFTLRKRLLNAAVYNTFLPFSFFYVRIVSSIVCMSFDTVSFSSRCLHWRIFLLNFSPNAFFVLLPSALHSCPSRCMALLFTNTQSPPIIAYCKRLIFHRKKCVRQRKISVAIASILSKTRPKHSYEAIQQC